MAHFITSDTSLTSPQECGFSRQVFVETQDYIHAQDCSSAQARAAGKERRLKRMVRPVPVLKHLNPSEERQIQRTLC